MVGFTQKLRMGFTFYQLYRRHSFVRLYSKTFLTRIAPDNYKVLLQLLD